ncbi:MAG: hypothetical protein A3F90_20165 [Deltaproteobacteria bacterium RIFCSPLOWO2_12_FULL_60_19]|nr:MAG: hypothetical protein A3F90_20165 [Deltaproteobacteria bacterium RIFCSPLOWO2_12_FULL_60_19]
MYPPSQILTSVGLVLSIIGSIILVWRATKTYFASWFSVEAKRRIEDEAISVSFNRLGMGNREAMVADSIAQGFIATYKSSFWGFILLILGFLFQFWGTLTAASTQARWAYMTPPWTFNEHDKYAGREFSSIPVNEWKQEAAFDSAARCEQARLFAYKIRNVPQGHREQLLGLFASGVEKQATEESAPLIARYRDLENAHMKDPKLADAARDIGWKVIKQWEASKCVPLSFHRP